MTSCIFFVLSWRPKVKLNKKIILLVHFFPVDKINKIDYSIFFFLIRNSLPKLIIFVYENMEWNGISYVWKIHCVWPGFLLNLFEWKTEILHYHTLVQLTPNFQCSEVGANNHSSVHFRSKVVLLCIAYCLILFLESTSKHY